eukprot:CAMPEP_0180567338 /NCGR_PEP_ID=MMETSP1037_2-20121125/6550_1 /TAXON_ID=632150 /ORGANISM="Azadinium spinosum, Strain 3D9" /LENGTH=98 /DNA_ID=CAMNT_0022584417 /DNA_START=227 /DNA_END=520 /DNA_ORIENTATION=-
MSQTMSVAPGASPLSAKRRSSRRHSYTRTAPVEKPRRLTGREGRPPRAVSTKQPAKRWPACAARRQAKSNRSSNSARMVSMAHCDKESGFENEIAKLA